MSRHPLDHDHTGSDSSRTEQYSRIEREEMPSEATKKLQRRPEEVSDDKRLKEFLDIERREEE